MTQYRDMVDTYTRQKFKGINTFHHIIMRGGRGMNIVENDQDRWDFIKLLYYLNDTYQKQQWERDLKFSNCALFERPDHWPDRDPLVLISAYCLLDNHFHLLVKEIREGGISKFMHRLPNSMSLRYNKNYGGSGSIFQSSYKSRMIETQADLMNVTLYVTVKNVFERYPEKGLNGAVENFEDAHKWALQDEFSSYADFAGMRNSPIVDKETMKEVLPLARVTFKKKAGEYLEHYVANKEEHRKGLFLE